MSLVKLGEKARHLKNHGLEEGVSTRLLIYAGDLIRKGIAPTAACEAAVICPITDDADMQRSLREIVSAIFEDAGPSKGAKLSHKGQEAEDG